MLARRGREDIHVYERLSAPAGSDDTSVWSDTAKFYLVGLGGRGQKALQELGAWERVERCCTYVLGRKDWAPGAGEDEGVERIFPMHSPRIAKIEVVRHGDARRAKLYFLRDRIGKARRLRDRRRGLKWVNEG